MIKIVLFDIDGVIINGPNFSETLEKDYGLTVEKTWPFFSNEFADCTIGKKDLKQEISRYLPSWGWKKSTQDFIDYWFESDRELNHDLILFIQKLRKKGVKCIAATNQEKHRTEYLINKLGFTNIFDDILVSAHLGTKKPDITFFNKVWVKLNQPKKNEVLFWDDREINIRVAKEFGYRAELYSTFSDFKKKMVQHLRG